MRMQAVFADTVLAESDRTIVVEGNHYFPPQSLSIEHFRESSHTSLCPWKGRASYYTVDVGGAVSPDAAWTYRRPTFLAARIKDHVAFWNGVEVREAPDPDADLPAALER